MTTRERKIEFIDETGGNAIRHGVLKMLSKHGADWLTDEQVDDLYRAEVLAWDRAQLRNAENREVASARRGRDEAA